MILNIIIVNIIWALYSLLEGFRESYYWYYKANSKSIDNRFEIHPVFSFQRVLVLILISYITYGVLGWWFLLSTISLMLIFSYLHNGFYYLNRNILDDRIYKLGWKDQSTTSTAKMTKIMTYRNRTIMFMIGVIVQIILVIFLKDN
jgi:hypothetical protein